MITKINLSNFKLHKETSIDVRNLTILTGMNGMGKSSIIQAILLLRQSGENNDTLHSLNLKGDLCDIGTSGALACQSSESNLLDIELTYLDYEPLKFSFEYPKDPYDTELKSNIPIDFIERVECPIFCEDFQYIGAFRFGPQKSYNRDTNIVKTRRQISKVMGQCEYAIHFMEHYKHEEIPIKQIASPNTNDDDYRLLNQVELWMRMIAPNIKINVEPIGDAFKLNYKFIREKTMMTESMSAINVGFGITYVLPIVVAILSARKGSLIIIENPEAHIHPKGQAVLMELITLAAKNGVQIILETHSDHIINGALVSIIKKNISDKELSVYYFDRDEESHTAIAHQLKITETGRIKRPPTGFFDQIDIDLKAIMGF